MFLIRRPSEAQIRSFLEQRENDSFSYREVGASIGSPPAGYNVDRNRILLGRGEAVLARARLAITEWRMFEVPGMRLCFPDTPIQVGRNVAPVATHLGFYSLNACRIVYVVDEPNRFGFAYGTLTQHAEIGEERFTIEFDPDTGEVWYDVFAFSRPGNFFVQIGYPYSRYRQKRFSRDSKAAMLRAAGKLGDQDCP